jgi:hypothetical protein
VRFRDGPWGEGKSFLYRIKQRGLLVWVGDTLLHLDYFRVNVGDGQHNLRPQAFRETGRVQLRECYRRVDVHDLCHSDLGCLLHKATPLG